MAKSMPPLRQLSALSFIDYVHIKQQVEDKDNMLVNQPIGQHDKDPVTFIDAYMVLKEQEARSKEYTDTVLAYTNNLISSLCTFLASKGLLTEKDINNIVEVTEQMWEAEIKGENNKDE